MVLQSEVGVKGEGGPAGSRIRTAWMATEDWIDCHPLAVRLLLLVAFLASRLPGLSALPPFIDEGYMLSRSWGILQWPPDLDTPLSEGGRLLLVVAVALAGVVAGLPDLLSQGQVAAGVDWLVVGRSTVVLAGAVAMLGCFQLGSELYSGRAGLLSALLYLLLPLSYFHDRMIMADPFVSAFGVWTVTLSLQAVRSSRPNPGLLGASMALGLLSKTLPALFFVVFPLWTWLWFRRTAVKPSTSVLGIAKSYAVLGLAVLALVILLGPARVGRVVGQSASVLSTYQLSPARSVLDGVYIVAGHFQALPGWLLDYLTLPGLLLLIASAALSVARREGELGFLLASAGLFVLAFMMVPGWILPRYLLPSAVLLAPAVARVLVLATDALTDGLALGFTSARARPRASLLLSTAVVVLMVALIGASLRFQRLAVVSPQFLPMPAIDRWQYIQGWPSGYGFREALEWIQADNSSAGRPQVLVENASAALLGQSLRLEMVYTTWWKELGSPWITDRLRDPKRKVYAIASVPGDKIEDARAVTDVALDLVASYPKPVGVSWVQVYRVRLLSSEGSGQPTPAGSTEERVAGQVQHR